MGADGLEALEVARHAPGDLGIDLGALADFVRTTGPLAIVDLETTGLPDDPDAGILEFGAVLLDASSDELITVERLVRPKTTIPRAVQRLTGLRDEDVADAPPIEALAAAIAMTLDGRSIVAHNADFERSFLSRFVSPVIGDQRFLDTQDLLSITHSDAPDLRLETFTRRMLATEERHRALSDALDTLRVMSRAAVGSRDGEARYTVARGSLEAFAPESPWLPLLAKSSVLPVFDSPPQFVEIGETKERRVPFDADAIAEALGNEARGRRHFPEYRVREEQIRMARNFAALLDEGGTLLLEGGTGVGKSLAYLAAAIPFSVERAEGGVRDPVVVSTRTKLLQDQLLLKDIPSAAAMLGYPDLKALSIKGRANYVCERRSQQVLAEGREPQIFAQDRLAYAALASCARLRRHGEVGTIPGALLFRFPPLRDLLRRSVAARAEQCTREQCASERSCPFGQRRAALAKAHLVVANHDLLLRWPPDYPNFQHAIVDEAHEIAGVVDEVYAVEVRPEEVLERLDELFGRPAERRRGSAALGRGRVRTIEKDALAWRRGVQQDLAALGRSLADRASEFGEIQLPAYAEKIMPEAAQLAATAADRLDAVASAADDLDDNEPADEGDISPVERITGELRDSARALRAAFASEGADSVAAFERLNPPYDRWRLAIRAVAPAQVFHDRFVDKLEGFACVSASLFVGGDPFAALGELELESFAGADDPLTRVSVASPFPYGEHMRVVAMRGGDDLVTETAEVLATLTRALGGRTLGLFTSLRRMRDVGELLSQELRGEGYDILSPRRATDDPAALVQRFSRAGGGGVLLGARTFWQGLDIPGDALQAVVIEKLPFEVPTELRKRREARIKAAGGDAFGRYTMGKMLLNLKQMVGRLIRAETDRGIAVIVEGRTDRRYFGRLREALPAECDVQIERVDGLAALLREVGIDTRSPAPKGGAGGPRA